MSDAVARRSPTHRPANLRNFPEGHYRNFRIWALPLKLLNQIGGTRIMLPQTSLRSGLFSSTGRGLRFLIGGCSVLLATLSVVIGIEVSVATASPGAVSSMEIVDRARKGNRLPLVPALHQNPVNRPPEEVNLPRIPAPDRGLADGCESLASPLTHSPLAQIAGRCLS